MTNATWSTGLQTIFSIFLGLMLTVFFGIGVYTFYPPPTQFADQIKELNRQEQVIKTTKKAGELTGSDRDQLEEIALKRRELMIAAEETRKPWCLSTSIILIIFSTLTLVVSLVRAVQLQVVSNGLLLGGVFTMLYGMGWIAFAGTSTIRFLVMTAALIVTLVLGYVRFVRKGKMSPTKEGEKMTRADNLEEIERRIHDLEARMNDAAKALGKKNEG
ncbi:MAG: hypothetical protein JW896_08760 [Deltaproteobacteria bacterium]|nr:hypothetical protein [Deltaproteobacteria bacterium]